MSENVTFALVIDSHLESFGGVDVKSHINKKNAEFISLGMFGIQTARYHKQ